ncbi:MAG: cupredoxin domain-containing protein [Deltaproteobacteria bacterium]|nr:cupredoxin domain-containing protein [Deltaproteobacteria bacterium]
MTTMALLVGAALAGCERTPPAPGPVGASGNRVAITVNAQGYQPPSVTVPAGRPVTLVFTRTVDDGCGAQLVFPSLNIRRDLPLNEPVEVTFTPTAGTTAFTCGMSMLRGAVVAQ